MGYEYAFIFNSPLEWPQVASLTYCLQTIHPWLLVQAEQQTTGYLLRYAYSSASAPTSWGEDFLLEVSSQQVYLLLHTATGNQLDNILAWLQQSAAKLGFIGTLVEI